MYNQVVLNLYLVPIPAAPPATSRVDCVVRMKLGGINRHEVKSVLPYPQDTEVSQGKVSLNN